MKKNMQNREKQLRKKLAKIILELETKDLQGLEITGDKIILKSSVKEFIEKIIEVIKEEINKTIDIERKNAYGGFAQYSNKAR